jgi:hypothetical protein
MCFSTAKVRRQVDKISASALAIVMHILGHVIGPIMFELYELYIDTVTRFAKIRDIFARLAGIFNIDNPTCQYFPTTIVVDPDPA